jgi:hypothetical protein
MQEGKAGHYVRCELPARYLPGKTANLDFTTPVLNGTHPDGSPKVDFPDQEGAAIWCLPGNATRGVLMRAQQLNGTRVLVEVDDNYLTMPPHKTEWQKDIVPGDQEDHHSRDAHRRIVQNVADGIIVSTPYLEKRYQREIGKPVFLCRNTVDPQDWECVKEVKKDDEILRFGWSASESHRFDAALIAPAMRWLAKQDGVICCLVGLQPAEMENIMCERAGWTNDLEVFRKNLAHFDVGFCPVKRTDWSAARSDLKALEYSMAGAVSIVSKNEPYDLWQSPDMPCLQAGNHKEFLKAAQWCVKHRDELKAIARQAKDYVLAERTTEKNVWHWEEAIA